MNTFRHRALPILGILAGAFATSSHATRPEHVEGSIQLIGRMRVARSSATATVLAGDKVLIAGGMTSGGGAIREFEVFDASGNRIVATGNMTESRIGHTATKLNDGRVLILGGYNGNYLKSAAIFDPRTSKFVDAGSMNVGRSGQTASLLADGTVLIVGGVGDGWSFLSSAEVYDPRTGQFRSVGSLSAARESHTATVLADGRVLITGGHRDRRQNITVYSNTEIYDPATGRFSAGPSLTMPRHKHEAVGLTDGRVLVLGGSDRRDSVHFKSAEVCDVKEGRCRELPSMRVARFKFRDTGVRLRDGRVLIMGSGRTAEIFDPRTNSFSVVDGDFGKSYSFASSVLLDGGDAIVAGGYDNAMRDTDGIWRFRE